MYKTKLCKDSCEVCIRRSQTMGTKTARKEMLFTFNDLVIFDPASLQDVWPCAYLEEKETVV